MLKIRNSHIVFFTQLSIVLTVTSLFFTFAKISLSSLIKNQFVQSVDIYVFLFMKQTFIFVAIFIILLFECVNTLKRKQYFLYNFLVFKFGIFAGYLFAVFSLFCFVYAVLTFLNWPSFWYALGVGPFRNLPLEYLASFFLAWEFYLIKNESYKKSAQGS